MTANLLSVWYVITREHETSDQSPEKKKISFIVLGVVGDLCLVKDVEVSRSSAAGTKATKQSN